MLTQTQHIFQCGTRWYKEITAARGHRPPFGRADVGGFEFFPKYGALAGVRLSRSGRLFPPESRGHKEYLRALHRNCPKRRHQTANRDPYVVFCDSHATVGVRSWHFGSVRDRVLSGGNKHVRMQQFSRPRLKLQLNFPGFSPASLPGGFAPSTPDSEDVFFTKIHSWK